MSDGKLGRLWLIFALAVTSWTVSSCSNHGDASTSATNDPTASTWIGYIKEETTSYESEHCADDDGDKSGQDQAGLTFTLNRGQKVRVVSQFGDGRYDSVEVVNGDWKGCVPEEVVSISKPPPTPTPESYEHRRAREKSEFFQSVDKSITGPMIAGNKFKYVNMTVELHCTVLNIPDRNFFNANCGDDDDQSLIVVQYETTDLTQGQSVRILGTVEDPVEGTNAMGGTMQFPTVKAEFME